MLFMPSVAVVLALGIGSSLSFPTQVSGLPLPQLARIKEIGLGTRDSVHLVGRKKKSKQASKSSTPPKAAPATAAPANRANATSQVLRIKQENPEKIKTNGFFGTPNNVQGRFLFTKMNLPPNAVGNLEVECNGTEANIVHVAPKMADTPPPRGMVFVDPMMFIVSTEKAPVEGDTYKIDYIFTEVVKLAVDPAQVRVGKLNPETKQFVMDGLGKFKFEKEENEWSQEVKNLNGEWGILAPQSAQLPEKANQKHLS